MSNKPIFDDIAASSYQKFYNFDPLKPITSSIAQQKHQNLYQLKVYWISNERYIVNSSLSHHLQSIFTYPHLILDLVKLYPRNISMHIELSTNVLTQLSTQWFLFTSRELPSLSVEPQYLHLKLWSDPSLHRSNYKYF